MTDHSDLIAELLWQAPRLEKALRVEPPLTLDESNLMRRAASALSSQSLSLSKARAENDRKDLEIERLKKLSDRYGVALMMIRAGCSDPARFAGNILDDQEPVNVELDEEDFDENHR